MADSDSERPPVVLGQEMAAAQAAEEKHIPSGPSPLASHRYAAEHHDLVDFVESPDDALSEAARLSNSNLAGQLKTKTTLADALYLKYESGGEVGLIRRGINEYAPSTDLVAEGIALTHMFRAHGLMPDLEVATSFPRVWFGAKRKRRSQVPTGALTIRCRYADDPDQHQHFVAFLGEFRSTGTARRRESAANAHNRSQHARLAVRVESVLCLVIARSIVVGVPQRENDTSLARFETEIRSVLSDG